MELYIASYDLEGVGRDYSKIDKLFYSIGARRILTTTWLVPAEMSADELAQFMRAILLKNDRLFVGTLSGRAIWQNPLSEIADWLQ